MRIKKTFKQNVYSIASKIPKGKVVTYGQLAKMAGNPQGARAVGMFMHINPDMNIVPCHRVVGSDGKLTGYSAGEGLVTKKKILTLEGVKFSGHDRVDLSVSLWKPSNSIN